MSEKFPVKKADTSEAVESTGFSEEAQFNLAELNREFESYNVEGFTMEEFFNPDVIEIIWKANRTQDAQWPDVQLMRLYRIYLDRKVSLKELGMRFGGLTQNHISVVRNRYFSKRARDVARRIRYNNPPLINAGK